MSITTPLNAPKRHLSLNQLLDHLLHLETTDVNLKFLFDHIRNYTICGAMALGGYKILGVAPSSANPVKMVLDYLCGGALISVTLLIFVLNLLHGVVAVSKVQELSSINKTVFVIAFVTMALIAIRVVLYFAGW